MLNARNLTKRSVVINSVHDSIRPKDDLANAIIPILGNDATQLWEFLQPICLGDQFVSEGHCAVGIVARDEDDYVVKVVSRSGRPD
jgi:hypothetical protein